MGAMRPISSVSARIMSAPSLPGSYCQPETAA